ncbi:MAG: hypothetical protein BGO31_11180 [Bacteroidetes bacterium 43-16]|uniref:hypothetical protein n=1 Tax=uncultured Dysgonomonas sp. TaxID=206096 RepID=UPI00092A8268|nr:hypothetical protein [uncultured Dysgonomonas sp.]OJV51022.1 MAG: hypothetical protein BGO31_11180 [Bacteroidetes bacterium 43-16]
MQEEPRFLVGNHIYRIDSYFGIITQAGNADNQIRISELPENLHSYDLPIDPISGKLLSGNPQKDAPVVSIPKTVLEEGYLECSKFAENFNAQLSEQSGIRLVDEKVKKEIEDLIIPLPQPQFPVLEKDGYKFEVDVSLRELRNVDKPFIHIELDRLLEKNGKYIAYILDEGRLSEWDHGNSLKLEIDQLVKIAPDDVSKVYGIPKDKLPETDKELRSNPEYIVDRIDKGKLPVMRIVDEDYYVDTRLHELRSMNKHWKKLELIDNGPEAFEADCKHVYLYDYLNRQIVKNFNELTEVPKHTAFIVLPDLNSFDPVAAGRKLYNDPYALLNKYPLQPLMEARLVPIEKTYLAERIQYNKEKKLLEKSSKVKLVSDNKKIIKPGKKNNKGNGLPF